MIGDLFSLIGSIIKTFIKIIIWFTKKGYMGLKKAGEVLALHKKKTKDLNDLETRFKERQVQSNKEVL